jgi:hypothetical protein
VSEGLNSKIQTIKKKAYGYRNREHFKIAVYEVIPILWTVWGPSEGGFAARRS